MLDQVTKPPIIRLETIDYEKIMYNDRLGLTDLALNGKKNFDEQVRNRTSRRYIY